MKRKFCGITVFLMAIILLLAGCGRGPQVRPDQKPEQKTRIVVSSATALTDDFKIFKKTMEEKAKDANLDITWLDAQNNALRQEEDIKKAIRDKVKVAVIEPVNAEMIKEAIGNMQKEGVKVICLGSLPPDTAVDAFIAPDFERAGEMQAQQVLDVMKDKETVNILILRGGRGHPVFDDILQGNLNILDAHKKTGQVWMEEIEAGDSSTAFDRLKKYLERETVPDAVLAHSPEITAGALKALKQFGGEGKVKTFGMGTQKQAIEGLEKGIHTAEIDFMPELLAQIVVEAAEDLGGDEPWEYEQQVPNGPNNVPARFTPTRSITQENVSLLKERAKTLQADGGGAQQGGEEENEGKDRGSEEEGSQEGNPGNPGEEKKKKTVVKIKTKDGQEFEMNIFGEIESIEMKGEEKKEGEDKKEGEEGGAQEQQEQ